MAVITITATRRLLASDASIRTLPLDFTTRIPALMAGETGRPSHLSPLRFLRSGRSRIEERASRRANVPRLEISRYGLLLISRSRQYISMSASYIHRFQCRPGALTSAPPATWTRGGRVLSSPRIPALKLQSALSRQGAADDGIYFCRATYAVGRNGTFSMPPLTTPACERARHYYCFQSNTYRAAAPNFAALRLISAQRAGLRRISRHDYDTGEASRPNAGRSARSRGDFIGRAISR